MRKVRFASHIVSSLTMEGLRTYCEILDNINLKLLDKPDESTLGGEHNAVFFTREQLAAGLRFLVPVLVKQFFHFTRVPPALVYPNIIWILTGCSVLNILYQLDLSLVEIFFAYTLTVRQGGRMSMSILDSRLQFVNGLPDSSKIEAKGFILVRGPWDETLISPDLPFDINRSQSFPGMCRARKLIELRHSDTHLCLYVGLIMDYCCKEKLERQVSTVGGEGEP